MTKGTSTSPRRRSYVYAGAGRGKTTAALGHALRRLGVGESVFVVQFLTSRVGSTEVELAGNFADRLEIRPMGPDRPVAVGDPDGLEIKWAEDGLALAIRALRKGPWGLVVADRILDAVERGLLDVDRVGELLDAQPSHIEVVLTGQTVPLAVVAEVDSVVELVQVKQDMVQVVDRDRGAPPGAGRSASVDEGDDNGDDNGDVVDDEGDRPPPPSAEDPTPAMSHSSERRG